MPLIGIGKENGERIDITTLESPRSALKFGAVVCPSCQERFTVVEGKKVINHFRHLPGANCAYGVGETQDHLAAKVELAKTLRKLINGHQAGVDLEVRIDLPSGSHRVADILVSHINGWRTAHEIQLASISAESLTERTLDYASAGVDVIWWLGKTANTYQNREFVRATFGFVGSIKFESDGD